MALYRTCENCGATLDLNERCDCERSRESTEQKSAPTEDQQAKAKIKK